MTHLITYADKNYNLAAKLLISEARALNIFDRIHCYTPREIKEFLSDKWISQYAKGGGYWIWKPYIALQELEKMNDGDILLYADAGASFRNTSKWQEYFNILTQYDAVFMRFNPSINYGFTPTIRCWTKKSAIQYFLSKSDDTSWLDAPQFIAGCFFIKKTPDTYRFIKMWCDFMCTHQELVFDTTPQEQDQDSVFVGHRHDQAILSLLLYTLKEKMNFKYLFEEIEWHDYMDNSYRAIIAARRNDKWIRHNIWTVIKRYIKYNTSFIKKRK